MKNKRRALKLLSTILSLVLLVGTFAGFSASAAGSLDMDPDWEDYRTIYSNYEGIDYTEKVHFTEKYFPHGFGQVTLMGDAAVGKQVDHDQRYIRVTGFLMKSHDFISCSLTNSFIAASALTASGKDLLPDNVGSKDAVEGSYMCEIEHAMATRYTLVVEGFVRLETNDGHFYRNTVKTTRF